MDNRSRSYKLGGFIENELKRRGWIPEHLAKLMGVDGGQVSKIIKPRNPNYEPTIDTLEKVAKAFDMKIENLISKISDSDDGEGEKDGGTKIFGYSREVEVIERVITFHRLIFISGLAGVGKTIFVKRVIEILPNELIQRFEKSLFCPLNDGYDISGLANHLSYENVDERDISFRQSKLENPSARIIEFLNRKRYLLVLDNLDLEHPEHGESYRQLLKQIAETAHQSCVIVTCRILPRGYSSWEPIPQVMRLDGLTESEAYNFLVDLGVSPESDPGLLKALFNKYGGNPFGLRLAAWDILQGFKGDLAAYLKHSTLFAGDLHDEIQSIVDRLSSLELEILYWLALQREPIYSGDIFEEFPDRYKTSSRSIDIDKAIKELDRRSLLQSYDSEVCLQTEVQTCVEIYLLNAIQSELEEIAADSDVDKLYWLRALNLSDEKIKLRDRLSRRDPELTDQAYIQLEAVSQQHPEKAIGYAIANLRYLLGY